MNFDHDFFLPLPHSDCEGVRKSMADYGDVVGQTKMLLQNLQAPVWAKGAKSRAFLDG